VLKPISGPAGAATKLGIPIKLLPIKRGPANDDCKPKFQQMPKKRLRVK